MLANAGRQGHGLRCAEAKSPKQDASGGLPPALVRQIPYEGRTEGKLVLRVEHDHQRGVHLVSVEPQVVGEFGDIRALSGEHNLSGSVFHRHDGLSQLTARFYRKPHLCIDVVEGAEGVHQVRRCCCQVSAPAQCAARRQCPSPGSHDGARVGASSMPSSWHCPARGHRVSPQECKRGIDWQRRQNRFRSEVIADQSFFVQPVCCRESSQWFSFSGDNPERERKNFEF